MMTKFKTKNGIVFDMECWKIEHSLVVFKFILILPFGLKYLSSLVCEYNVIFPGWIA